MERCRLPMHETAVYRLHFQGGFDESWLQDLGTGWTIRGQRQQNDNSTAVSTSINGVICDQAALIGFLTSLNEVGLPLLEVECLETSAGQSRHDEQQTEESEGEYKKRKVAPS